MNARHRDFIRETRKRREHLIKEIQAKEAEYDKRRKAKYDSHRVASTQYKPGDVVFIDCDVGKVGNKRKLGINRKRAIIVDQIGDNSYSIRYQDGKIEPVNVDRLYTVSRSRSTPSNPQVRGKHSKRNYKRRTQKRKLNLE